MTRTFTGPNSFALKKALADAKAEFLDKYGDLSVEVIDGEEADYNKIVAAVESVPFLADKKLVIAQNLSALKETDERIEQLMNRAENANDLIIVESKIDKRGTYYKYLKANTKLSEFKELDERELANWLVNEAKDRDGKIGFSDAYYLVQRVGGGQEMVFNELRKLIDYDPAISRTNIDLLSEASPQTNVFNLMDAAFSGDKRKTITMYDQQRVQGVEPLNIFGMIVWQMHLVAIVSAASGRNDSEIMQKGNIKPFVFGKTKSIANRMGPNGVKDILAKIVEADRRLKTTSADADDTLKNLLLSL